MVMKRAGLSEPYHAARNDPKLTELRDELALVDVRMAILLDGLQGSHAPAAWDALAVAVDAGRQAQAVGDSPGVVAALARIEDVIQQGVSDRSTWDAIIELTDARRKLAEAVVRIERRPDLAVPVEQVMGAIRAIVQLINEEVSSRDEKGRVVARLLELTGGRRVIDVTTAN